MDRPGHTDEGGERSDVLASLASHTPDSIISLAGSELAAAIYRTANALLGSSVDAEEVTLDALVQLHKKLGELGETGFPAWLNALPGWLDKVAVGKTKGRAHKRKRHSGELEELTLMGEQLSETENPKMVSALLVKEILAYLPRRHRFVLVLKYGLGHGDAALTEFLGIEAAMVTRTVGTIVQKLGDYATYHPTAKAMFEGVLAGSEDNPLHDYMEAFGGPDEVAAARIKRRFETYLRDGPGQLELSGDHSFHDGQFSGSHYRIETLSGEALKVDPAPGGGAGETEAAPEPDPEPLPTPDASGRWVAWVFGTVAVIAVGALFVGQREMTAQLEALDETLQGLGGVQGAATTSAASGPTLLEPGAFVELAHGSRAEPSKDASVELLRDDTSGAAFRLNGGSISLHVKHVNGVEWVVRDGDYTITAIGTRFRVTHTNSAPEVEVFQGRVRVEGGLLGTRGVVITSAIHTLTAAMELRGDEALAELPPDSTPTRSADGEPAIDNMLGRALALRSQEPDKAEILLHEIIALGGNDWVTERAYEQLRTLVDVREREQLRLDYIEHFPKGKFMEAFAALKCKAAAAGEDDTEDAPATCWSEFGESYPDSLYGP